MSCGLVKTRSASVSCGVANPRRANLNLGDTAKTKFALGQVVVTRRRALADPQESGEDTTQYLRRHNQSATSLSNLLSEKSVAGIAWPLTFWLLA